MEKADFAGEGPSGAPGVDVARNSDLKASEMSATREELYGREKNLKETIQTLEVNLREARRNLGAARLNSITAVREMLTNENYEREVKRSLNDCSFFDYK